jgi:hypothetical protein
LERAGRPFDEPRPKGGPAETMARTMASDIAFDDTTLFIGLGPPRSGSRWLSNYLAHHSDVLMSPIPILNYFTKEARFHEYFETALRSQEEKFGIKVASNTQPLPASLERLRDRVRMNHDPAAYLEYFRKRWSSERVIADVTPSYYVEDRDMFARMRDAHGKVRFLLVLRNPIDRIWSGMRLAQMQDPTLDPVARLDSLLMGKVPPWRRNYVTTLTDLDAVVPGAEVKVNFFEEMFNVAAMSGLCDFLGVETEPADFSAVMNRSEGASLDAERRGGLYAKFEPIYRYVRERYGRLPDSWIEDMERFGSA